MTHGRRAIRGQRWAAFGLGLAAMTVAPLASAKEDAPVERPRRPVDVFPGASRNYRRLELPVPRGFEAACERVGLTFTCRLSEMPRDLVRLITGIGGGEVAGVDLIRQRQVAEVRFNLRDPRLEMQSAVLVGPTRWVVEIGRPELLLAPIEDEVPFQPYPMPATAFPIELPPTTLSAPEEEGGEAEAARNCHGLWRAGRLNDALSACARVDQREEGVTHARLARMVIGEVWAQMLAEGKGGGVDQVGAALAVAEEAALDPVQAVRYALLAAQAYERLGFDSRAELHLDVRTPRYAGTLGEPYLLAGRARLLLAFDDVKAAKGLLEQLREMPPDRPNVGSALFALAGMAYRDHDYLTSVSLYDVVRQRWPEYIVDHPANLFQLAELYLMYDRVGEARRLYEAFLERYGDDLPNWVVRVRLAEIRGHTDPAGARRMYEVLAGTLRETEGQDLAYLRLARLTERPAERRRLLRSLHRGALTDYVLNELLVESTRDALSSGDVRGAYEQARRLWTVFPDSPALRQSRLLFDRVLSWLAFEYAAHERPIALFSLYVAERPRFEAHIKRGAMHLWVGKGLRALAAPEEAMRVLQAGLGGRAETDEAATVAEIYLEMAGVLREAEDTFRLASILDYLDASHPKRFDDFEYWMAKAVRSRGEGELLQARDQAVYALNGPVTAAQRIVLAGFVAAVYQEVGEWARAVESLRAVIALHDEAGLERGEPVRRDARWRIAELFIEAGAWADAIAAIGVFLAEYPQDEARHEAMFFEGRALAALGDVLGAGRRWDQLVREDGEGAYGRLAALELDLARWRGQVAPELVRRAGLAKGGTPTPPSR